MVGGGGGLVTMAHAVTLQWSAIEVAGEVPTRCAYHSAVAMRFKLLVFGGQGAAAMGDLWQFSPGCLLFYELFRKI